MSGPQEGSSLPRRLPGGLVLLFEDREILVVDKPAGLLTVSTEREKERTAYFLLTDYVRRGTARSRNRVFIVHRLDRETSGLLVFARTEAAKRRLQAGWPATEKRYLAVVQGRCDSRGATITSYLAENKAGVVHSTRDRKRGKLAQTAYRVLKQTGDMALLEVVLLTGRKNQIRVHLAEQGHPVVGDRKYGAAKTPHRRLALHAWRLSLTHPATGQRLQFTASIPGCFRHLIGRIKVEPDLPIHPAKREEPRHDSKA